MHTEDSTDGAAGELQQEDADQYGPSGHALAGVLRCVAEDEGGGEADDDGEEGGVGGLEEGGSQECVVVAERDGKETNIKTINKLAS